MQTTLKAEPLRMTYEQFRQWAGEDTLAEWVDGEVIPLMPPKEPHQSVLVHRGTVARLTEHAG